MNTPTTANHDWLPNALSCAFARLVVTLRTEPGFRFNDERWTNAHILQRYRFNSRRQA
jgi:hypothetical protein